MHKHSGQEKIAAVHEALTKNSSLYDIAKRNNMSLNLLKRYLAVYRGYGEVGLLCPPKLNIDFKIRVTEWTIENDANEFEVAEYFGYTGFNNIDRWKELYLKHGADGWKPKKTYKKPQNKNNQMKKVERLENKVQELEAENRRLSIMTAALKLIASRD